MIHYNPSRLHLGTTTIIMASQSNRYNYVFASSNDPRFGPIDGDVIFVFDILLGTTR